MNRATLYITDLDGTLLGNDARVSPQSAVIINELTAKGAMITVATARTPATVVPLLEGIATRPPAIVMTGAGLWDRAEARFLSLELIPREHVAAIAGAFGGMEAVKPFEYAVADSGGFLDVYHAGNSLTDAEKLFVEQRSRLALKRFHLGQALPGERYGSTALFFAMGPGDAIKQAAAEISRLTPCYVSYYKDTYLPDLWLLEIFAEGVSKAVAVERLRKQIGAERVVVFGDNLNDIGMMRVADVAVAVENALPAVKEAATVVIGPNTSDAVARYIADDL